MDEVQLKCLSCGHPVGPTETKLYYRVFVCKICYDRAEQFVVGVRDDLRKLEAAIVGATRHGLLNGLLQYYNPETAKVRDRMVRLIEWSKDPTCLVTRPSSSTVQATSPLLSSGESTEPSAAGPDADGERSSSTTNQ